MNSRKGISSRVLRLYEYIKIDSVHKSIESGKEPLKILYDVLILYVKLFLLNIILRTILTTHFNIFINI